MIEGYIRYRVESGGGRDSEEEIRYREIEGLNLSSADSLSSRSSVILEAQMS